MEILTINILLWKIRTKQSVQIELKEEVAQGTYANLAIITHSSSEFILDFVRVMPGIPKAGVQSRVVLAPNQPNDASCIGRKYW